MKKLISTFLLCLLLNFCFCEAYKISAVYYDITSCELKFLGTTRQYSLEQNVNVDKNQIFETVEELDNYIDDYRQRLHNLRAFETINVSYYISETQTENFIPVILQVHVTDSIHLLAVPYIKYDSNTGLILKLKAKDTNFLGSLNPMNFETYLEFEQKSESDKLNYIFSTNFSYDYPFKCGIFNATWVNDYGISYTLGNNLPEWNAKTGLKLVLPKDHFSYCLEFYQSAINNFDYLSYGDNIYFSEHFKFSVPYKLYSIKNFSDIYYTPYIDFTHNWDFDGLSNNGYNYDLTGPSITPGHSLSTSRIDWHNNLRDGYNISLLNTFSYNASRNIIYPFISFESQYFNSFNIYEGNWFSRFGLALDFYAFKYIINENNSFSSGDGTYFGERLRGIRDYQNYSGTDIRACKSISALVLNIDLPFHIYSSNFENKLLRYFNFDLQFNPFIDIALNYNKITNKYFNLKDGFYASGLEILVYPQKFSNYVIRASVGYDIGRAFFSDYLNTDWRSDVSKYEISFGLGLHF